MFEIDAIVLDFETRSTCDLPACGADIYATDPTTDILCIALYDLTTGENGVYAPDAIPETLMGRLIECDYVMAHNARFDKLIWHCVGEDDYGYPHIPSEKWYCTMAQMRVNALPASLDEAGKALGVDMLKSSKGKALIKKLSIPQKDGTFIEDLTLMQEMAAYCMQDVLATVDCIKKSRLMTGGEFEDYLRSEEINDLGVKVDVQVASLAQNYAEDEQKEIADQLKALSNGLITKHTQHKRIADFVLDFAGDVAVVDENSDTTNTVRDMMTVYKKGEKKYSMDKNIRATLLAAANSGHLPIPDDVKGVIECSDNGNKSSVAKFKRMLNMACPDDHRVRGAFQYAGAGQTKRYSSKGMQVHNFTRDCLNAAEAEEIKQDMIDDWDIPDVMPTLSKMLRPAIVPEDGKIFVVGDWSAIEGRILPWLSGDISAEATLDIFRNDEDIYMYTAESMGMDDRQIGKVATLALGFQGAVGAFMAMAKNYGLFLPETQIQSIVDKWRLANPWAVRFWKALEIAAMRAMQTPTVEVKVGKLAYQFLPNVCKGSLFCHLPNGEVIQYPEARLEEVQTPWGSKLSVTYLKASVKAAAGADTWPRAALYGGLAAENATQATAAALLRRGLNELDDVVLHVHDEIVLEVPIAEKREAAELLQEVMEEVPEWATGLPLKAEPEYMVRYGK